ncbi:YraN family protein [Candidatus Albibeggiatoa sp. nov. NOAA]|uniref:YraN family protein n=1 Tax=Candidatus Albibeggiatoa sp. nov. NOAA TaxID=3162724 RepID=UPI0032F24763|nr:YraN family protein [Thiotrichaceae bacterium]
MSDSHERGRWAEEMAYQYLTKHGLSLIRRNYRCRSGEIDLVMKHGRTLVFIEVRYRARDHFGTSAESIDERKQQRLYKTAEHYIQNCHDCEQLACRFDAVLISGRPPHSGIEWIRNAFQG